MKTIKLGGGVNFFQEFGTDNFIIEKPHMAFHLGERKEAIRLVRAILVALGEPGEAKPDRAPLKGWARYVRLGDNHEPRYEDGSLDDLIRAFTAGYDDESRIYELVAYVGPKPQPAERKVVRL